MSLFGKKKEENRLPADALARAAGEPAEEIRRVKVLGAGRGGRRELLENTKEALKNMGLSVEVEYVTDMKRTAEYGVMGLPALVADERPVSAGKALKVGEIERLLRGRRGRRRKSRRNGSSPSGGGLFSVFGGERKRGRRQGLF